MAIKTEYTVERPLNREPPIEELVSSYITTGNVYDRNHGPIPYLSAGTHKVEVTGFVQTPLILSISQLQNDFPQAEVVCALQCAGNRRHTMRTWLKEVDGIDWGDGAVMNCQWKGVRLRDVLMKAGVSDDVKTNGEGKEIHVTFACFQTKCQDDDWFGASIPLQRAMRTDGDVLLAFEMNGQPLTPQHGFPVRVIAPGIAGARCVKWLDRIIVQDRESENFYQQHDYKILPPEAVDKKVAEKYFPITPAIQDMPINSVITYPRNGSQICMDLDGMIEVRGYALPGGDKGPVVKVEVEVEGGDGWIEAEILGDEAERGRWSWVLWRAKVKTQKGVRRLRGRAVDLGGNTQVEFPVWNLRGVGYNGYGESRDVKVL